MQLLRDKNEKAGIKAIIRFLTKTKKPDGESNMYINPYENQTQNVVLFEPRFFFHESEGK